MKAGIYLAGKEKIEITGQETAEELDKKLKSAPKLKAHFEKKGLIKSSPKKETKKTGSKKETKKTAENDNDKKESKPDDKGKS